MLFELDIFVSIYFLNNALYFENVRDELFPSDQEYKIMTKSLMRDDEVNITHARIE